MSLLHKILFAHRCSSTHQKIILDALRHLRGETADAWRKIFLKNSNALLVGAKAPDQTFKDFRNHVLHVRERCWGGAVESAETWYKNTVDTLRAGNWPKAAYAAGVLSHYYADPLMPLHTGQTEEASIIRRACSRSVFRCYDQLTAILERDLGGYPDVKIPSGNRWLAEMVKSGARRSHEHYDALIDHYQIAKAIRNPAAAMDDEIRVRLAECLGLTVVGFARILERAIEESEAQAPRARVGFAGLTAWFRIPGMRFSRRWTNGRERRIVKRVVKEFRKTGKAIRALPEDEQVIRRLHAEEVLKTNFETLDAMKVRAIGTKHGTGTYLRPMAAAKPAVAAAPSRQNVAASRASDSDPELKAVPGSKSRASRLEVETERRLAKPVPRLSKFHLDPSSSLADAPSIGNRTAEKLAGVGIRTVAELLAKKPEDVTTKLKLGHIKPDVVREWQVQARLACRVPNLRALDVKILVACGICEPEALAQCEALDLLDQVDLFVASSEGQRAIRGGSQPDLDTVSGWIESARNARTLKAA